VNAHALLELQLLDTQLDQLAGERKRLPERAALAAATAQQSAWSAEESRLRGIIASATAEIADAERQGADLDAKRARLETQLRTVSTQRQADALTHEIEMIVQHHSDLDDSELAAMEAQGDAEAALVTLYERQDDVVGAVGLASTDLDRVLGRLDADEALLVARRAEADAALTDAERSLYVALRARFGGMGICQLEGRRCTGCHLDLSATESDEVRHAPPDELPECPHCGRLIVR
jgi:predicted  nucleic acid-binding Zn-ribbon protein